MRIFSHQYREVSFNLALEEVLMHAEISYSESADDLFFLWRNAPAVIVGRHQNLPAEVNLPFADEAGISVARRLSGGGAVYHDEGNINYTLIRRAARVPRNIEQNVSFAEFTAPIVHTLSAWGVPAEFTGRNDILAEGRKFSGNASYRHGNRVLFHGTLLFSTDLERMEKVLTPSVEKFAARGVASVRSRVVNLGEYLPQLTSDAFALALLDALRKYFAAKNSVNSDSRALSPAEIAAAEKVAARYRNGEWNFGNAPNFAITRAARFACGSVTVCFSVARGAITDLAIHGDFFSDAASSEEDVTALVAHLHGCVLRSDALAARLATFNLSHAIRGITEKEFLSLFA